MTRSLSKIRSQVQTVRIKLLTGTFNLQQITL